MEIIKPSKTSVIITRNKSARTTMLLNWTFRDILGHIGTSWDILGHFGTIRDISDLFDEFGAFRLFSQSFPT